MQVGGCNSRLLGVPASAGHRPLHCGRCFALALLVVSGAFPPVAQGYELPQKFVIVSNPFAGNLRYARLPPTGRITGDFEVLVKDGAGLSHPQGLAIDQKRGLLFVADSGLAKLVSYGLSFSGGRLVVDEMTPVVENVEVRWVAVDGQGNVIYSDEENHRILKISSRAVSEGTMTSEVIYEGEPAKLSAPGGVATDNNFVYWTNKLSGTEVGSVVKAVDPVFTGKANVHANDEGDVIALAKTSPKSFGLCLAIDQIFFTQYEQTIWVANKTGGGAVAITNSMGSPRGCAWDGMSRVVVADRGDATGLYAFPAPMTVVSETKPEKLVSLEEVFGVAIYNGSTRHHRLYWCLGALIFSWCLAQAQASES